MRSFIADFVRRHGWPAHAADHPLCIGHRGASAHANGNTLAAFRVAATLGADMWELDARLSRDGVVVVSHDDTVAGANGRQITLAAHDATDIGGVMLERGGTVPTLQAAIDLAITTGCGLYVEVKERAAALPALRLLSESAVPFAAIGSFDHDTVRDLAAVRHAHPRYPCRFLFASARIRSPLPPRRVPTSSTCAGSVRRTRPTASLRLICSHAPQPRTAAACCSGTRNAAPFSIAL